MVTATVTCDGSASWGCSMGGVGIAGDGGGEVGVGVYARSLVTGWRVVVDCVCDDCGVELIGVLSIGVSWYTIVSQWFA